MYIKYYEGLLEVMVIAGSERLCIRFEYLYCEVECVSYAHYTYTCIFISN